MNSVYEHLAKTADRLSWIGGAIAIAIGFSLESAWTWGGVFIWFAAFQAIAIKAIRTKKKLEDEDDNPT